MCEALPLKKCSKCGEEKSLLHFHKHKQSKDGHKSRCKICNIEESKAYVLANQEIVNSKAKLRGKKANYSEEDWKQFIKVKTEKSISYFEKHPDKYEQRLALQRKEGHTEEYWEAQLARARRWNLENKDQKSTLNRLYRESNPKKYVAQSAVGNALRTGSLIKCPCEVCGKQEVHGHHYDYSKPLDVMWLCPEHHSEWHRLNGEGLNAQ